MTFVLLRIVQLYHTTLLPGKNKQNKKVVCSLDIHLKTVEEQMGVIHGRQENFVVKKYQLTIPKRARPEPILTNNGTTLNLPP